MAFDIDRYKTSAAPVETADLDFGRFADQPLPEDALRCIRYMNDIEGHTVCYLRDLLVTPSHQDPEVTTFLTMWNYEEYWHGEALSKVLAAHGEPSGEARQEKLREQLGWQDKLSPLKQTLAANLIGDDFIAVHMTWGAINEWSTYSGYQRLIERADHPILTELLHRIMRQETRHVAFYVTQARMRLARSRRAQKLTRFALKRFWAPVGSNVMPRQETEHLLHYLMDGPEGARRIAKIDGDIDSLPGLGGLSLVKTAARKYGVAQAAVTGMDRTVRLTGGSVRPLPLPVQQ